jgi:hypothetical protein
VALTTLLLLVLVAMALASIGRRSFTHALAASTAAEQLQRRWGVLSCHRTLLLKAEQVLSTAQLHSPHPLSSAKLQLSLGSQKYILVFSDEQAKVNMNHLYARLGPTGTEPAIRSLTAEMPGHPVVRLQPAPSADLTAALPAFGSYAQIFDSTPVSELIQIPQAQTPPLGCWGDGRLNVHRASEAALQTNCAGILTDFEIYRLLQMRKASPELSLGQLLDQLQLHQDQRRRAEAILTNSSTCHALWIIVQTPQRYWYHLAVNDPLQKMSSPMLFEW